MSQSPRDNSAPSYSEVLRVIGTYADQADFTEVRVLETEDGYILQGLVTKGPRAGQRDTYQLTHEDIQTMVVDAHARRGKRV